MRETRTVSLPIYMAACQIAESLPADQVVVTVLCDTGERYLSVTF